MTLLLLSEISSLLYNDKEDGWLAPLLIAIYVLFVPICIYVATRNPEVTTGIKKCLFYLRSNLHINFLENQSQNHCDINFSLHFSLVLRMEASIDSNEYQQLRRTYFR